MKPLTLLTAFLFASPALAHPGFHVAPHGSEWIPVFMGLAVIAAAGFVALRDRRKVTRKARK